MKGALGTFWKLSLAGCTTTVNVVTAFASLRAKGQGVGIGRRGFGFQGCSQLWLPWVSPHIRCSDAMDWNLLQHSVPTTETPLPVRPGAHRCPEFFLCSLQGVDLWTVPNRVLSTWYLVAFHDEEMPFYFSLDTFPSGLLSQYNFCTLTYCFSMCYCYHYTNVLLPSFLWYYGAKSKQ